MQDLPSPRLADRYIWFGLAVLALIIRSSVLISQFDGLNDDPDAYRQLAGHVIDDGVFGYAADETSREIRPTAFRPPLYPTLLALCGWADNASPLSVALLHLILGIGTVLLTWRLAVSWRLGVWSPLPALLVACDPILLHQSTLVMTETLATFMAVLGLWLMTRCAHGPWRRAAAAGAGIALASLCRPAFLIWLAACFCGLAVGELRRIRRRRAAVDQQRSCDLHRAGWTLTAFFLAACLVMAPWILRNGAVFGRPVIATTHGGYTLLLGNNEGFYEHLRRAPLGDVWDSAQLDAEVNRMKAELDHDETAVDRWAYDQAKSVIRQNRSTFLYACAVRAGRLWRPLPHRLSETESVKRRAARYVIGAWYAAVFAIAIAAACRLGPRLARQPWVWGLLLCLAFTALHTFYWSNLRMRAPLMPMIYLVACSWRVPRRV